MAWLFFAAVYEYAALNVGIGGDKIAASLIVVLLAVSQTLNLEGRFLPRWEEWRGSAHYINDLKGCDGQLIPVVALPLSLLMTFLVIDRTSVVTRRNRGLRRPSCGGVPRDRS